MDSFLARHEKVVRENERLRMLNQELSTENKQLTSSLHRISNNTTEEMTQSASETKHKNNIDEEKFRAGLQPKEHGTSSPVNMETFAESWGFTNSEDTGSYSQQSQQKEISERLIGEIAYQLDRRILTYVFHGHKRFYGFNVSNIPSKILEVSTHHLTGRVDEDYRLHLNQRYENIKDTLSALGYNISLHPHFSEFIVNTYGILQMRPEPGSSQTAAFYNPLYLKSVIETTAPPPLHKDLLLLLNCLNTLAQMDEKPILLW